MALTLTPRAAEKVRDIFSKNDMPESASFRVAIKGGGCSGLNYHLDVAEKPDEFDEVFESEGITIICDPKSLLYIDGTEIDYVETMMQGSFQFNNPNAGETCGCGASFST